MDADRLNKWLTLGANLGVLAGIILLILELDQNREAIQAQTRNDISQGAIGVVSLAIDNPHLAEVIVRYNRGEELSDSEQYILDSRSEIIFRYFENVHYQYRLGTYDEDEFSRQMVTMKVVAANTPSLRKYWCENSSIFSERYEEAANEIFGSEFCK
jgi:hypothetical protein